jgi:hypothetical protein
MTADDRSRRHTALHLLFIVGLSCYWESLFIGYGVNPPR